MSTWRNYTSDSRISVNSDLVLGPKVVSFFLLCPQKTKPLFLSLVQLHKRKRSAIICPTHKPCYTPQRKIPFLNPGKNLFMGK